MYGPAYRLVSSIRLIHSCKCLNEGSKPAEFFFPTASAACAAVTTNVPDNMWFHSKLKLINSNLNDLQRVSDFIVSDSLLYIMNSY